MRFVDTLKNYKTNYNKEKFCRVRVRKKNRIYYYVV